LIKEKIVIDAGNSKNKKILIKGFKNIKDTRTGNGKHSLADALMSGFAMFSLKDPSLLQFDARRSTGPHNLKTIYGIGTIPCDTTMREILDVVDPNTLRPLFKDGFRALQRGKALEQLVFMDGYYLLNFDGTGYFNSKKLFSDACMEKVDSKTGEVSYYIHAVGAVLVHPDHKMVIPLCPEMIIKQPFLFNYSAEIISLLFPILDKTCLVAQHLFFHHPTNHQWVGL